MNINNPKKFTKLVDQIMELVVKVETKTISSASKRTLMHFAILPDLINNRLSDVRSANVMAQAGRLTAEAYPVDAVMATDVAHQQRT